MVGGWNLDSDLDIESGPKFTSHFSSFLEDDISVHDGEEFRSGRSHLCGVGQGLSKPLET